jgi:hypothetical protein
MNLVDLPNEVILHVLRLLSPYDVLSVRAVNRRMSGLAGDNRLWHGLDVSKASAERSLSTFWEGYQGYQSDYGSWANVDWYSEWLWRYAPTNVSQWLDPPESTAGLALAFCSSSRGMPVLFDNGTVAMYRQTVVTDFSPEIELECTGYAANEAGKSVFRTQSGSVAVQQLGFNNAIDMSNNSIFVGMGSQVHYKVWLLVLVV